MDVERSGSEVAEQAAMARAYKGQRDKQQTVWDTWEQTHMYGVQADDASVVGT